MEKIVYVSLEHKCESDDLDILSPKQLDKLMEEKKFSIVETSDEKITHPKTGKTVTVTKYRLSDEKERALTVTDDDESKPKKRGVLSRFFGRNELTEETQDDEEDERALSNRSDNGSYLGSGSDLIDMSRASGVNVAKSCSPAMAYTMGTDAAAMDMLAEDCPFKRGTKPYAEWMRGFRANGGDHPVVDEAADKEAYEQGKNAAKGPKDQEVTCPYPPRSRPYKKWLEGYKDGGGDIIVEDAPEDDGPRKIDNGFV